MTAGGARKSLDGDRHDARHDPPVCMWTVARNRLTMGVLTARIFVAACLDAAICRESFEPWDPGGGPEVDAVLILAPAIPELMITRPCSCACTPSHTARHPGSGTFGHQFLAGLVRCLVLG